MALVEARAGAFWFTPPTPPKTSVELHIAAASKDHSLTRAVLGVAS